MIDYRGLVKSAIRIESMAFGDLHHEVDHAYIGEFLRLHRLSLKVKAVDVAEEMKVSKSLIALLEKGERNWDIRRIKFYAKAVDKLSERAKAKK